MTSPTVPVGRSPFAEPTRRVGGGWIALFATTWFGIWMAQLAPFQLLLPTQVSGAVHGALPQIIDFGIISGIAGICSLIAYPLTGWVSDRTTSRYGRRRPWILIGVLVFGLALIILGFQTSIIAIGILWPVAIIGFCIASAAITATVSDQVPVNQRGFVSGWISAPQALGTIVGLIVAAPLALWLGYVVVGLAVIVFAIPFVLLLPDQPLRPEQRPAGSGIRAALSGFWVNPVTHPDFGWTLLGRILVNFGNALGVGLLLYFLEYGLGQKASDAQNNLIELVFIYLIFFILAAVGCGLLSDRIGRRKIFVYISAYLQALAALLLAIAPAYGVALFGAALLGAGYGCYMAVDQALATQVLPDAHSRGKDLGIMNIATAFPQAFGPLIGAVIVLAFASIFGGSGTSQGHPFGDAGAGFSALFIASGILSIVGAIAMIPIKSVK